MIAFPRSCVALGVLLAGSLAPAGAQDAEELLVRTVDTAGEPVADVALALSPYAAGAFDLVRENPITDGAGRARLPVPRELREELARESVYYVVAEVLAQEPVLAPLDLETLDRGELELRLPHTGRLSGRILDPRGGPAGAGVAWFVWQPGDFDPEKRRPDPSRSALRRVVDGSFLSPPVARGSKVHLRIELQRELSVVPCTFAVPAEAGEVAPVELRAAPDMQLVARLVDPEGAPLGDRQVLLTWAYGRLERSEITETDGAGWIRQRFAPHELAARPPSGLTVRWWPGENLRRQMHSLTGGSAVRVELPPLPLSGATDLGELVVAPLPVLAAGLVVDEAGAPIADARVRIEYQRAADRPDWWTDEQHMDATTGPDGRFEVRAWTADVGRTFDEEAHGYRVDVRAKGYLMERPLSFVPGAADLRVVLPGAGRADVEPICDELALNRSLRFELRRASDGGSADGPERLNWMHFRWHVLPPGTYELLVRGSRPRHVLARVPGLEVRAGELLRDPRLCPLDLRGALRPVSVTVRDESGRRILRAGLDLLEEAADVVTAPRATCGLDQGQVTLLLAKDAARAVVVFAEGYRPLLLARLAADATVALRPALRVTLRLAGLPEGIDPTTIHVDLRHADDSPLAPELRRRVLAGALTFDAAGEVELQLPGPGRYATVPSGFGRTLPLDGRPSPWAEVAWESAYVDVRDSDDGGVVTIHVPRR